MRIRKHASKILGTAANPLSWFSPPPPPPPEKAGSYGELTELVVCHLNLSPWDATPFAPQLPISPKEEEEGIMGKEIESVEEPVSVILSTAIKEEESCTKKTEDKSDEDDCKKITNPKSKKRKTKKRKMDQDDIFSAPPITCKKTDGKLWRCKQQAHHPNAFCHYHLTQLRSYTCGNKSGTRKKTAKKKKKKISVSSIGSSSNFYYYYSQFSPWRGKRRGGGGGAIAGNGGVDDDDDDDNDNDNDNDSGSGSNNNNSNDVDDSDEDDEGLEEDGIVEEELSEGENERDKGTMRKKRGRKPVKARSLKSLL